MPGDYCFVAALTEGARVEQQHNAVAFLLMSFDEVVDLKLVSNTGDLWFEALAQLPIDTIVKDIKVLDCSIPDNNFRMAEHG